MLLGRGEDIVDIWFVEAVNEFKKVIRPAKEAI
jgi:hypothetical protein